MNSKLDMLLQTVAKLSSDHMPAVPELPDDISLPLESVQDLEKVEEAVKSNSAAKDALVSASVILQKIPGYGPGSS
jgi:hypothetical protein